VRSAVQAYGWPSVFYVFAVLGLAWAVVWPLAQPERRDAVMRQEEKVLEAIEAKRRRDADEAPADNSRAVRSVNAH
jgi:hypothetical protein